MKNEKEIVCKLRRKVKDLKIYNNYLRSYIKDLELEIDLLKCNFRDLQPLVNRVLDLEFKDGNV